jgi:hypothetical protein
VIVEPVEFTCAAQVQFSRDGGATWDAQRRAEVWHLIFVDLGEVAIYCPECAEREFEL